MKKYRITFISSDPNIKSMTFDNVTNLTFIDADGKTEDVSNEQLKSYVLSLTGEYRLFSDGVSKGSVRLPNMVAIYKSDSLYG